jgi:Salmonella virulence plasmid 65kDa B protein
MIVTRGVLRVVIVVLFVSISQLSLAAAHHAGTIPGSFDVGQSGAASYSIPISVPPGIGGMQPSLSLNYNSQGGNGLLGMGWTLGGVSSITRCPSNLRDDGELRGVDFSNKDKLCLDGQRLVPIGTNEYRTQNESYSQIKSYGSVGTGPAYFIVKTKSGQTMEYGNTSDSFVEAQGRVESLAWAVNKISDVVGNNVRFQYDEDSNHTYYNIKSVKYYLTGSIAEYASVSFEYTAKAYVTTNYLAGSLQRQYTLLSKIKTALTAIPGSVAEYQITYVQNSDSAIVRLVSVTECAYDGLCKPATKFDYENASPGWLSTSQSTLPIPIYARNNDNNGTQFIDINGDELIDLIQYLYINGTIFKSAWLNTGTGWVQAPQYELPNPIWNRGHDNEGTAFVDLNGDGLQDFVRSLWINGVIYKNAWLNTGNGWVEATQYSPPNPLWSRDYDNEGTAFIDVNGDGLVDLVRNLYVSGTIYKSAWLNTGSG